MINERTVYDHMIHDSHTFLFFLKDDSHKYKVCKVVNMPAE